VESLAGKAPGVREVLRWIPGFVRGRPWQTVIQFLRPTGIPICLQANTELPIESRVARKCGAEGIGLFRSEFLFFGHPMAFPISLISWRPMKCWPEK